MEIGHSPKLRDLSRRVLPEGEYLWLTTLVPGGQDWPLLVEAVAALYCRGVAVNWSGFDRDYQRRKVAAPLYPFQRSRYWPDIATTPLDPPAPVHGQEWKDWLYEPRWEQQSQSGVNLSTPACRVDSIADVSGSACGRWLIFADQGNWGRRLAEILGASGGECTFVHCSRSGESPSLCGAPPDHR